MRFIDRLLESRKIVTKVLLFVVPLVVLMAGVGMLGYYTASMLNGHMTVTRATIGNINDLDDLQGALQEFVLQPSEAQLASLTDAIEAQEAGLSVLDGVLAGQAANAELTDLRALPERLRTEMAAMWQTRLERQRLYLALQAAVDGLRGEVDKVQEQLEVVRTDLAGKEQFAKELLFDASAFKALIDRLGQLRAGVQMAFTPEEQLAEARLYTDELARDLARANDIASDEGKVLIAEVSDAFDRLNAILAGPEADDAKADAMGRVLSELVVIEQKITLQAAKNNEVASDRFVSLNDQVEALKELSGLVDASAIQFSKLELHMQQLRSEGLADLRKVVLDDLAGLSATAARISELAADNGDLRDFAGTVGSAAQSIEADTSALLNVAATWESQRLNVGEQLSQAMTSLSDFVSQSQEIGREDSERSATISVIAMVLGTLLAIVGGLMLVETLRGPLKRVTDVMSRLASGDLSVPIDGRNRADEIGDMVRSVTVLRDAALQKRRLEEEAGAAREMSARETELRAIEREKVEADQRAALGALSHVLQALARGELDVSMRRDLPGDFVAMAENYNSAIDVLRMTLEDVRSTSVDINAGTENLAVSADDLARRTEQQAAALEESVRALAHLNDVVRATADGAVRTAESVTVAREQARKSGEVVNNAVLAMGEISRSSDKISTIISVIDEIAFQTNLLALNAGVEAARAGEAGRGFAVVAQEVRDLAQRCAGAARQIKELISVSSQQVKSGVALVEETGDVLQEIIRGVEEVQGLVEAISLATKEQSTGISEVTHAVRDVELITQQNAAMVEENNAEIQGLRQRVELLMSKIAQFKTGRGEIHSRAA